jgi:hypothetical protein
MNCGKYAAGPQSAGTLCHACSPVLQQQSGQAHQIIANIPAHQQVSISHYRDARVVASFLVPEIDLVVGAKWFHSESCYFESMILSEVRAVVVGSPGDADLLLNAITVRIQISDKTVFERSLGLLVANEKTRDAETEDRLARLERLMNVMVEQDSPAGEALRRLGGAKIVFESPTRLSVKQPILQGEVYSVYLDVDNTARITSDVIVRISLIGVAKNPAS